MNSTNEKHLGYSYWFELYIMQDVYGSSSWHKTIVSISQYIGFLKSWKMYVHIENSTVRYFVGANSDLGMLSNNLEGVVLRPVGSGVVNPPVTASRESLYLS